MIPMVDVLDDVKHELDAKDVGLLSPTVALAFLQEHTKTHQEQVSDAPDELNSIWFGVNTTEEKRPSSSTTMEPASLRPKVHWPKYLPTRSSMYGPPKHAMAVDVQQPPYRPVSSGVDWLRSPELSQSSATKPVVSSPAPRLLKSITKKVSWYCTDCGDGPFDTRQASCPNINCHGNR
jgi:hypothetical protein